MTSIVTYASKKGRRKTMEDVIDFAVLPGERLAMVVCDGHGGHQAARYLCKEIMYSLKHMDETDWDVDVHIQRITKHWNDKCVEMLRGTKYPTNTKERQVLFQSKHIAEYTECGYSSGSTLVMTLIDPKKKCGKVWNLGDSKAMYKNFGDKQRARGTRAHAPNEHDLGVLGGTVEKVDGESIYRVNGELAVGRAFGDNTEKLMGSIKHESTCREFKWDSGMFRMVLATDGVTDVISVSKALTYECANKLVCEAIRNHTNDNVTAGIITIR